MKFCYADPPYLGLAVQCYGDEHPDAADYDRIETHAVLIDRLSAEFPDGWALSLHSPSLRAILPLCPPEVRVMAWVKPFCSFKPNVRVAYAWEPLIVYGGRARTRDEPTVRDYISCPIEVGNAWRGRKARQFCFWMFEVLGMHPDDEFVDLFHGSGEVARAWVSWKRQRRIFGPAETEPAELALGLA